MRRRWRWLGVVAALVLLIAWWFGNRLAERPVPLLVVNRGEAPVHVVLHGPGIAQDVLISGLAPSSQRRVILQLEPVGAIWLRVRHTSADIDSALLDDGVRLRERPHRLELGPGNRFVLVPVTGEQGGG